MHKSALHSLIAFFAAAFLLLQHAPLVQTGHTGHGADEHCIHCTANYCTKDACFCGHKHKADAHKGHEGHAPQSHSHSVDHSGQHVDHSEQHADGQTGAHTAVRTTIKPCGAPPSGIITLSLDKFVASVSAAVSPLETERPSSARYVGLADQLVIRQIFHPPVLG